MQAMKLYATSWEASQFDTTGSCEHWHSLAVDTYAFSGRSGATRAKYFLNPSSMAASRNAIRPSIDHEPLSYP